MYDEQLRTNKEEDQQFQGRTDLGCELRQVTKVDQCIIAPTERYSAYRYFQ